MYYYLSFHKYISFWFIRLITNAIKEILQFKKYEKISKICNRRTIYLLTKQNIILEVRYYKINRTIHLSIV